MQILRGVSLAEIYSERLLIDQAPGRAPNDFRLYASQLAPRIDAPTFDKRNFGQFFVDFIDRIRFGNFT